ncbi:MAG: HU family DNA-binding protein [Prevotella sp.]|nr:HU family DNA-binding protein [Prevotella sp.]
MNNKEFVAELSRRMGYKNEQTSKYLQTMVTVMGDAFTEDCSVQIQNFGAFEVKKKLERVIVNPTTGQRMLVPPKLVLGFKPNPVWKEKIKNGGSEQ